MNFNLKNGKSYTSFCITKLKKMGLAMTTFQFWDCADFEASANDVFKKASRNARNECAATATLDT